jgi:hypothetical protein
VKILKQLAKEFWLPFVAAAVWAVYSIYGGSISDRTIRKGIEAFAPSFFLASWLLSQYFRVSKQVKTDSNFNNIENRFKDMEGRLVSLINGLDSATDRMINNVTGGNSFPYIQIAIDGGKNSGRLVVIHNGEYPIYDLVIRMVDVNKFTALVGNLNLNNIKTTESIFDVGNMTPGHASIMGSWSTTEESSQDYNIFFVARNGAFTQQLRLRKVNGEWLRATRVTRRNGNELDEVFQKVDEGFPVPSSELWQ